MSDNRGPELAAVTGVFLGLAVIFTSLRIYVRTVSKNWGADDLLFLCSLVFFVIFCVGSFGGITYGSGQHLDAIKVENLPEALHLWWLGEMCYTVTTWLLRLSVGVFLLRLSVKPRYRWVIYTTMAVVSVLSLILFFLVLFQCTPVHHFWTRFEGKKGKCIPPNILPRVAIAHSVVAFCTDWVLGIQVIEILYKLEMNARTKLSVVGLLSLGFLAGIAAMIRIPEIRALQISADWLYKSVDVAIWSIVEPGLGIIAIAGATLRPLFRRFLSTRRETTTGTLQTSHTSQMPRNNMGLNKDIPYTADITSYPPSRSYYITPSSRVPKDEIVSSPPSACFDFVYGETTDTMTSTTNRVPQTHMLGVNSFTRPMSPAYDDDTVIDARDSIRGLSPTPAFVPSKRGIQVQRTAEIHELDELGKSPEGFIRSQVEPPRTMPSRPPRVRRKTESSELIDPTMRMAREDGMTSRGNDR
ncbi:hypothetical protein BJ875DRAFT_453254 [Amylocarpus encephaloides]|uniref:Rhodopsin domain-containing protein n=1 Tax=Amylocarpus encephaloides TaxID=45428 RepID=A0A9P7YPK5_9HELO|nr:hypothetical protein BJ875DRAFT_453254 [Amylocarpus encephaloides]